MKERRPNSDQTYGYPGGIGHTRGEGIVCTETVVGSPKPRAAPEAGQDGRRGLAPPSIVRRNTLLLAASQAFVGVGNQMVPTLGAIIVTRLLGSAHLAGIATSTLGVSRFLVSYPIGKVADTYGRRVAVVFGLLLGLAGAVGAGLSVLLGSFVLFLASILVFGAGVSAGYQLRVAAADMYPPSQSAQGLGYVLTGSLVGALGGPVLITTAQAWSSALDLDPLALTWILVPAVIVPGIGLVLAVHPDPKEIAANLGQYYPGYRPPPTPGTESTAARGLLIYLRDPRLGNRLYGQLCCPREHVHDHGVHVAGPRASRTSPARNLGGGDHPRHRHVWFLVAVRVAGRSSGPSRRHAPGIALPGKRCGPRAHHV
jgi:hypothetical protein